MHTCYKSTNGMYCTWLVQLYGREIFSHPYSLNFNHHCHAFAHNLLKITDYTVKWGALLLLLVTAAYMVTASIIQTLLLLEPIPSTHLNGSLRNFNTWRVSVGNRTQQEIFLVSPPPQMGPKYYQRLCNSMATLRANISGKEHDIDNRKRHCKQKGPYIVPKLHELWSING